MKFNLVEEVKEFNPVYKEKDDCYLIALCACLNINYEDAKRTGIKSSVFDIISVLSDYGYDYHQVATIFKDSKITLDKFILQHKIGTYYVMLSPFSGTRGHAVAVIDGIIYDASTHPNYNTMYVDGYFCVNSNSSHIDTSYIDDPLYFADFAIQYALQKMRIDSMDEVNHIKAVRTGTNTLQINIGGKTFDFWFPLNSSKDDNEKIIKKEIDRKT